MFGSRPLEEGFAMSRMSLLSSPLLLGFDEMERLIDRVGKGGDGYPPYNIERLGAANGAASSAEPAEILRITLAVAGFRRDQLEITLEDNQLTIRGRQEDDKSRQYIHRGIAARQFSRTFVLADGIEVRSADLNNGLLCIDLSRREPDRLIRKIEIGETRP
jgi:HSP20 family molecular chaperone IbpA